jgi:signal transduction histidine kinase
VVLSADVLAQKATEGASARPIQTILRGCRRLQELLDDLLRYSRSKLGGGMVLHSDTCDLVQALSEEAELLRSALPQCVIRFESRGDAHGHFDASRLREAVHNLVNNAAKYGDLASDIRIEVEGAPAHTRIAVTNAGPPVPTARMDTLFDPLRRGTKRASHDESVSLGLGLFLVREVALAHGGRVDATSVDGMTSFVIMLPRQKPRHST